MEKEKPKFASTTSHQEQEANGVLNVPNVNVKNAKSGSQSQENGIYQNKQCTAAVFQHAAPPVIGNDLLHLPPILTNHQHHPPLPPPFAVSSQPLWLPSGPSYQPSASHFGYHVGFPSYPGFPGSWEPSLWWNQAQQLLVPHGPYGYVSSQSLAVPNCVAPSGQPLLRGVIKPPEKLSHKHQRLWEAQSAENIQLWNMIGQLQLELADCKSRLIKLEAEISSLRPAMEEPILEVGNGDIVVAGQPAKRARHKREVTSVGSQPPLQHRARGRKQALGRTKVQARPADLERESLNKVDDKDRNCQSLDTREQSKNEKVPATINQNNGSVEIVEGTLTMPVSLDGQVLQQFSGTQSYEIDFKSSSLTKHTYADKHSSKNVYSIPPQHTGGFISGGHDRITNSGKGNSTWGSRIISGDSEQNQLNIACQAFYNNDNVSRQEITRWNFENVENATKEPGFHAVGYKNENEEMEDEEIETQNGAWCGNGK